MKTRDTTGADAAPLPISSHALKRQAKRAYGALKAFAEKPPEEVTLMYAQNFLAEIWGRTAWDLLKPGDALRPTSDYSASARNSKTPYLQRISPARGGAALSLFVNGPDEWAIRQRQFAEMIVDLEWERVRLKNSAAGIPDAAESGLQEAPPFSLQAMRNWLKIEVLEKMAWDVSRVSAAAEGDVYWDCYERLTSYLVNLPCYDRNKYNKRGGQGDDTRLQHGYITAPVSVAIDKVFRIASLNPVLWDIEWTPHLHAAKDRWLPYAESWLRNDDSELRHSRIPTFTVVAMRCGGQVRGVDVLDMLSLGTRSSLNQDLYSWISRPDITAEIAEDLERFMRKQIEIAKPLGAQPAVPGLSDSQAEWFYLLADLGVEKHEQMEHSLSAASEAQVRALLAHVIHVGEKRGLTRDPIVARRIGEIARRQL